MAKTFALSLVEEVEKFPGGPIVIKARIAQYADSFGAAIDYPRVTWSIVRIGTDLIDGWKPTGLAEANADPDVDVFPIDFLDQVMKHSGLRRAELIAARLGIVDLALNRNDTWREFFERNSQVVTGSGFVIDLDLL